MIFFWKKKRVFFFSRNFILHSIKFYLLTNFKHTAWICERDISKESEVWDWLTTRLCRPVLRNCTCPTPFCPNLWQLKTPPGAFQKQSTGPVSVCALARIVFIAQFLGIIFHFCESIQEEKAALLILIPFFFFHLGPEPAQVLFFYLIWFDWFICMLFIHVSDLLPVSIGCVWFDVASVKNRQMK